MNILERIRRTGFRYSFAIAFNRVVPEWLFRCRRYVVYQLATQLAGDKRRNKDVVVRWCESESEIEAVEALTYFKRSASSPKTRVCQATIAGDLAGGFWQASERFDETELGVRHVLEPQQVWLFAAYVQREYRRKGVYNEILQFMLDGSGSQGSIQSLVAVNPDNVGSNRVLQLYAVRSPGTVVAIRLLSVTICFVFGEINQERWISFNSKKRPIELSVPVVRES